RWRDAGHRAGRNRRHCEGSEQKAACGTPRCGSAQHRAFISRANRGREPGFFTRHPAIGGENAWLGSRPASSRNRSIGTKKINEIKTKLRPKCQGASMLPVRRAAADSLRTRTISGEPDLSDSATTALTHAMFDLAPVSLWLEDY